MTPAAPRAGRREWIGLVVLALPCMLYAMGVDVEHGDLRGIAAATALLVALPLRRRAAPQPTSREMTGD